MCLFDWVLLAAEERGEGVLELGGGVDGTTGVVDIFGLYLALKLFESSTSAGECIRPLVTKAGGCVPRGALLLTEITKYGWVPSGLIRMCSCTLGSPKYSCDGRSGGIRVSCVAADSLGFRPNSLARVKYRLEALATSRPCLLMLRSSKESELTPTLLSQEDFVNLPADPADAV
jgi:hypothetical protein